MECRDPAALGDFYSRLTGWPMVHAHADWYSVGENENAGFHLRSSDHRAVSRFVEARNRRMAEYVARTALLD